MRSILQAIAGQSSATKSQEQADFERYKQKAFKAPPSPSFAVQHVDNIMYTCDVYIISAVLYDRVDDLHAPRPQLYIKTRRAAVAKYILYEHDNIEQWPPESVLKLDPQSDAHRQLCLRMRRCGAIEGEPDTLAFDERYYHWKETFEGHDGHIFAWPEKTEGNTEPVWVYEWDSCADPYLDRFAGCDTLSAYCAALQEAGAKYYPDVRLCPEAKAANLVSAS
ncbi:hypothetical protein LTR37_009191 [Vermiconidia calcicola]|uniref:Uncharacterized protein n=1 Tax=Vermiconidia calcicola TaxID=1690605 RepID=A0ACC3N8S4_9PEZI|nr:hypothetical protein LTR37_009191 [Vermiconidia calcicola]